MNCRRCGLNINVTESHPDSECFGALIEERKQLVLLLKRVHRQYIDMADPKGNKLVQKDACRIMADEIRSAVIRVEGSSNMRIREKLSAPPCECGVDDVTTATCPAHKGLVR